jgi:hypothetical protein
MEKKKSRPAHKKISLTGKVVMKGDKLATTLTSQPLYQHFLNTHCKVGDDISIELKAKRPKRSESQNNFYHLYLDLVSLSSGHTMDELKAWVRETILGKGVKEVFGETIRVVGSSADLNTSEFVEMMNTLEEKTGIPIPDPAPFNLPLTFDEYGRLKKIQKEEYEVMDNKIKKKNERGKR